MITFAQEAPRAIQLITSDPAPQAAAWPVWMLPSLIGAAAVAAVATWVWWVWSSRAELDPAGQAFRVLARSLGMSGRESAVLREIAGAADVSPVAVLVSDHAFTDAVRAWLRTRPDGRSIVLVDRLCESRGLTDTGQNPDVRSSRPKPRPRR